MAHILHGAFQAVVTAESATRLDVLCIPGNPLSLLNIRSPEVSCFAGTGPSSDGVPGQPSVDRLRRV